MTFPPSTRPAATSSKADDCRLHADRQLLDAFRAGGREALLRVYQCHVDEVARVFRKGCVANGRRIPGVQSWELEREHVQEVFAKAFAPQARLAYDGLRPYAPYLGRIARNLLVDYWRKRGFEQEHLPAVDHREEPEGEEGPGPSSDESAVVVPQEDAHEWRAQQEATRAFLVQLDPKARELVRLRFEEELSQSEVAQEMKVSRWRVRALEWRVQVDLRKHLKQHGLL